MGDALAVALLEARGFTADDFARSHPGGSLGRRLLLYVADIMHRGDAVPAVGPDTPAERGAAGDDEQGPRHDRGGGCTRAGSPASSPTATCAARSTAARHARAPMREVMTRQRKIAAASSPPKPCRSWSAPHQRPAGGGRRGQAGRRAQHARPAARRGDEPGWRPPSRVPGGVRLVLLDVDGVLTDGNLFSRRRRGVQGVPRARRPRPQDAAETQRRGGRHYHRPRIGRGQPARRRTGNPPRQAGRCRQGAGNWRRCCATSG